MSLELDATEPAAFVVYPEYAIGTRVYHRCGELAGIVTGILLRPQGVMLYAVSWGDRSDSFHYAIELSDTRSFGDEAE